MRFILILVALLFIPAICSGQDVKNPTIVEFQSPDHNLPEVTGYELDIVICNNPPTCTLFTFLQTINIPKSNVTSPSAGLYRANVNVQTVSFGNYVSVMRTVAGTSESINSPNSNLWIRAPGPPSKPDMK